MKKNDFVLDGLFKSLHQSKYCGDLIKNKADAYIFILGNKKIVTKLNFRYVLKYFFGRQCNVEYVYKITPC